MNERLRSIIDLEKYPIYDLNSPIIINLINRCKQDLDLFAEKGRLIERSNMAGLQYDNYLNADLSDSILRTFPRVEGKIVKNPFPKF